MDLETQELTAGILSGSKDVTSQCQVHSGPCLCVMRVQQGGAQAPIDLLELQKVLGGNQGGQSSGEPGSHISPSLSRLILVLVVFLCFPNL